MTTGAANMFYYCTSLASFSGNLSSLTDGSYMFYYCTSLASFSGDLSSLTDGTLMFGGCKGLTKFTSDLSSLTNGLSMFRLCSLDEDSFKNIATTIKDVSGDSESHQIHLGYISLAEHEIYDI